MYEYRYLWGAAMIAGGLFLAFLGNKLLNAVIFLVTATVFIFIAGSLFFQIFLNQITEEWIMWASLIAIVAAGCLLGFILKKYRKYGVGLVAGWGGILLGFVLTSAFFISSEALYWVIIIGCGIGAAVITIWVEKFVVITMTSFIGSYAAIRGVSFYFGGFPSETSLHDDIKSGAVNWSSYDKKFYIYLVCIVVLFLISHRFQTRTNPDDSTIKGMKKFRR